MEFNANVGSGRHDVNLPKSRVGKNAGTDTPYVSTKRRNLMAGSTHLYGVTIHNAIKKGDKTELKQLLETAKATKSEQGDLDQAIKDLEKALGGGGLGK
jgi:hypothetical protein